MIARAFIIKRLARITLYESSLGRVLQVTLESALIYDCSESLKLVTAVAAGDYTQDYDNKSKIVIFRTGEQLMVISFKDIFFFAIIIHIWKEGRKEMFYLTTHSTHFIYGYMASDIW